MLKLKNQSPLPLNIDLSKVYEAIGETHTDLVDALFVIKNPEDNTDLITKTFGIEIIVNTQDTNTVDVQLNPLNDYGAGLLEPGGTYKFFFGIKTTNLNVVFLEIDFDDNRITITDDGISS